MMVIVADEAEDSAEKQMPRLLLCVYLAEDYLWGLASKCKRSEFDTRRPRGAPESSANRSSKIRVASLSTVSRRSVLPLSLKVPKRSRQRLRISVSNISS